MANQNKTEKDADHVTAKVTKISSGGVSHGKEIWYVTSNGKRSMIETSASSVTAMDEAMYIFSGALKRLAKR